MEFRKDSVYKGLRSWGSFFVLLWFCFIRLCGRHTEVFCVPFLMVSIEFGKNKVYNMFKIIERCIYNMLYSEIIFVIE